MDTLLAGGLKEPKSDDENFMKIKMNSPGAGSNFVLWQSLLVEGD